MTEQNIAGLIVLVAAAVVVYFIVKKLRKETGTKGTSQGGGVNSETGKVNKK